MMNHPDARFRTDSARRWQSWWLIPAIYLILGGVILIAELTQDNGTSGLIWLAVFAVIAAVYAFGGRFEIVRQARGDLADEREGSINTRAMAATGTVLVVALTACIVFELARGNDPSPYAQLMTAGGATYLLMIVFGRFRM